MFGNALEAAVEEIARDVDCREIAKALVEVDSERQRYVCPYCRRALGIRRFSLEVLNDGFHCVETECRATGDGLDLVAYVAQCSRLEAAERILKIQSGQSAGVLMFQHGGEEQHEDDGGEGRPIGSPAAGAGAHAQSEDGDIWRLVNVGKNQRAAFSPDELLTAYIRNVSSLPRYDRAAEAVLARVIRESFLAAQRVFLRSHSGLQSTHKLLRRIVAKSCGIARYFDPPAASVEDCIRVLTSLSAVIRSHVLAPGGDAPKHETVSRSQLEPETVERCHDDILRLGIRRSFMMRPMRDFAGQHEEASDEAAIASQVRAFLQEHDRALQDLACGNIRLAISVALRYRDRGLPVVDLIQAGNVGLLRACRGFDERRGARFSTYATPSIHREIQRTLQDTSRVVRVPVHLWKTLKAIRACVDNMIMETGASPTLEKVSKQMRISPMRTQQMMSLSSEVLSLSSRRAVRTLLSAHKASEIFEPEVHYSRSEASEIVDMLLGAIDERSRQVMRMRFGLGGLEEFTLEEVGKELGLTRERIRQLQGNAIEQMQQCALATELCEALSTRRSEAGVDSGDNSKNTPARRRRKKRADTTAAQPRERRKALPFGPS